MERIVAYAAQQRVFGAVKVITSPDLYAEWPQLERNLGFRFDDIPVLNSALAHEGLPLWAVASPAGSGTTILTHRTHYGWAVSALHKRD